VREDIPAALPARSPTPAPAPIHAAPPVKLEWPPDLIQVESDPHKVKAVQEQAPQEIPTPRQRRERPVLHPVSEEPLVQIETQKNNTPADVATAKPANEQTATTP
jgi:hypothetical protein